MQGHLMLDREPHSRRYWRLVEELKEDGIVETESQGEDPETDSDIDSGEEGSCDSDSDQEFDDEEDWYQEQLHFGSLPA